MVVACRGRLLAVAIIERGAAAVQQSRTLARIYGYIGRRLRLRASLLGTRGTVYGETGCGTPRRQGALLTLKSRQGGVADTYSRERHFYCYGRYFYDVSHVLERQPVVRAFGS